MSTEQKLDLILQKIAQIEAVVMHGGLTPKPKKQKAPQKKETSEEIANRLFAKIVTVGDARKAN